MKEIQHKDIEAWIKLCMSEYYNINFSPDNTRLFQKFCLF